MKHKNRLIALVALASLCLASGCRRVSAGSRATEEKALPTTASHPVYAGRAMLLLPKGVDIKVNAAEVNEVALRTMPDTANFEKKWAARVNDIRNNHADRQGFSSVDREWPNDHTVQFDSTRGTLDARTWERWAVLGDKIVVGNTVAPLDKANEAFKALADLFSALHPDAKPQPGDFRFEGGIARVPYVGLENVTAEWHEPVSDASGTQRAKLDFSIILTVVDTAGTLAAIQQDMQQRLQQTKQRGAMDGSGGVTVSEVRGGPITTHGLHGQESIIVLIDRPTGKQSFSARWESSGVSGDPYAPAVAFSASADDFKPADLPFLLAQWSAALQSLQFPRK